MKNKQPLICMYTENQYTKSTSSNKKRDEHMRRYEGNLWHVCLSNWEMLRFSNIRVVQTSTDNLRMRFDDHVCHDQKLSLYNFKNEVALHDVPESWEAISSSVYVLTIHGYRQFCCKLIYHFCHSNILQLYTY